MFENSGTTVFQSLRLSTAFLMSRLLKYIVLVFHKSFLQKMRCDANAFLSEKAFNFKNLFLSFDFSIMALSSIEL